MEEEKKENNAPILWDKIKMAFSYIPLELMYQIAEYLDFERDINALVRTSKRFYSALNRYLHRHHVEHWDATAFRFACEFGFSNSMRMFLGEGMSLDAGDRGWCPLTLAAVYAREDIVECLLEKGADPNATKPLGVFDAGYVTGTRDNWGEPFDAAVRKGHEGIVRLLIPHMRSVDYFVRSPNMSFSTDVYGVNGTTPLALAAENGHLNLVKMLVEELKCNVEPTRHQEAGRITWKEMSPLVRAAYRGHTDIVQYLLSVGADLNARSGVSWGTVLGYAVAGNRFETAKTLIEHGSDPNHLIGAQHHFTVGEIIIHPLACENVLGNQEMVNLLFQHVDLERILKCSVEDVNFLVPIAAACGLDGIVQRLLDGGCDVNLRLTVCVPNFSALADAGSALYFASKFGHVSVSQILLSHGADPKADKSLNPLIAAANAGHQQVVELLLDAGADPYAILTLAARSEPLFRMLLNRGVDPSKLSLNTMLNLLKEALSSQNVSILTTLLDTQSSLLIDGKHGVFEFVMVQAAEAGIAMFECMMQYAWCKYGLKLGPQSSGSEDVLLCAIRNQHARVVEVSLLRCGLKLESHHMVEYIKWAACGDDSTRAEDMLDVLLRHGADINARCDAEEDTCLSFLVKSRHVQGIKLVIKRGAEYPLTYVSYGDCLLSVATGIQNVEILELLLKLIDAQGISLEDIEPHLQQAQARIPTYCDKLSRLRLERPLQYFRWRRMYAVP